MMSAAISTTVAISSGICETLGVSLRARNNAGRGPAPKNIFFSGFSSQGDGASFEGSYAYKPGAHHLIRHHAPQDVELHQIADVLKDIQRRNFYRVGAIINHSGRYYHEYCMAIAVDTDCSPRAECASQTEEAVIEALRDLARWLYRRLESEYDYLFSDVSVGEAIRADGHVFTAAGRPLLMN
jgi:hypothetical protein